MYDYNFFVNQKGKVKSSSRGGYLILLVILTILVIGGITAYVRYDLMLIEQKIDDLSAEIQKPVNQDIIRRFDEKQTILARLQNQVLDMENAELALSGHEPIGEDLLDALVSALPSDAQINNMVMTPELVSVNGVAASRSAIAEYQYSLRAVPSIHDVYVSGIQTTEDGFTFGMTVTIGGDDHEDLD